jgi:hypothetical protein
VVSLDGYAAGEGQSREAGFGHAQPVFAHWFAELRLWRGMDTGPDIGLNEAIASGWGTRIGAEIMGRNKFRPTTGPWPANGWPGWWSEDAPFHTPCFVLTHYEKETIKVGDTCSSPARNLTGRTDAGARWAAPGEASEPATAIAATGSRCRLSYLAQSASACTVSVELTANACQPCAVPGFSVWPGMSGTL